MRLLWSRRFADSNSNFDLVLQNPEDLDASRMHQLLDSVAGETHRNLTLNGRALVEFRRFFDHPGSALKSEAYVLLSNWFMTRSGDRNSMVASRCEALWDELFPCRPIERLSSPAAGKNHIMSASEFQTFWSRLLKAQGGDGHNSDANPEPVSNLVHPVRLKTSLALPSPAAALDASDEMSKHNSGMRPLTIGEAKAALALTFGVSPERIEIIIRG